MYEVIRQLSEQCHYRLCHYKQWRFTSVIAAFALCVALNSVCYGVLMTLIMQSVGIIFALAMLLKMRHVGARCKLLQQALLIPKHIFSIHHAQIGVASIRNKLCGLFENSIKSKLNKLSMKKAENNLNEEYTKYINHIIQDTVLLWYVNISDNDNVPEDTRNILHDMVIKLSSAIQKLDAKVIVKHYIETYHQHLKYYLQAIRLQKCNHSKLDDIISSLDSLHIACTDDKHCLKYLRLITDTLLKWFKPQHLMLSDVHREFFVELITYNVLFAFTNMLSDKNWLNLQLLHLFADQTEFEMVLHQIADESFLPTTDNQAPNSNTEFIELATATISTGSIQNDKCSLKAKVPMLKQQSCNVNSGSTPMLNVPYLDLGRRHSDSRIISKRKGDVTLDDASAASSCGDEPNVPHALRGNLSQDGLHSATAPISQSASALPMSMLTPSQPILTDNQNKYVAISTQTKDSNTIGVLEVEEVKFMLPNNMEDENQERNYTDQLLPREYSSGNEQGRLLQPITDKETFEQARNHCILMTSLFTNLIITHTETATEPASLMNKYTLYCIQYKCWYTRSIDGQKQVSLEKRLVRRRYREFVNLQTRLESDATYKKLVQGGLGVKGPKKWISIPIGNMDGKYIESRRVFLQSYLDELCALGSAMWFCPHLQEFLAYSSDNRLAFVKYLTHSPYAHDNAKTVKAAVQDTPAAPLEQQPPAAPSTAPGTVFDPLSRRVSGVLDKIKGVLPHSTALATAGASTLEERDTNRDTTVEDIVSVNKITLDYQKKTTSDVSTCLDQLLTDISLEETMLTLSVSPASTARLPGDGCEHTVVSPDSATLTHFACNTTGDVSNDDYTEVSSSLLDVLATIVTTEYTWLWNTYLLHFLKYLLQTPLAIFLKEIIKYFISKSLVHYYLIQIRNTIWVNQNDRAAVAYANLIDRVMKQLNENPGKQHYLRQQTTAALAQLSPALVIRLCGKDLFIKQAVTVIQSIQHPILNRNFVFTFIDKVIQEIEIGAYYNQR